MSILLSLLLMLQIIEYPITDQVTIELNDQIVTFEEPAYIMNDRTIVPVKFLMNALGYEVLWDEEKQEVTCQRGQSQIVMIIDQEEIIINGQSYQSDVAPLIIEDRTYVPLALISRAVGAEVTWHGDSRTVSIHEKLDQVHYFYGPSSFETYKNLSFDSQDSLGYAWSRLQIVDGVIKINTSSKDNQMYIPNGFELAMTHDGKKLLNIYCDEDYDLVMSQYEEFAFQVKRLLNSGDPLVDFDGVILDFENLPIDHYENYYLLIQTLRESISKDIYLAIQPRGFDYHKLISMTDGIILMLHDYETKNENIINFKDNYVYHPMASIKDVKHSLEKIVEDLSYHEKSKLLLQFNLAVVQWQGESNHQLKRYTPSYKKLIERMSVLSADAFHFSDEAMMPYLYYQDQEGLYNTIWYENQESLESKIKLIFEHDLGGLSIWHIGNIPDSLEFELNIKESIKNNTQ